MPNIKRVLLTGATGFVGSHLYPKLNEQGFSVVCATRRPAAAQAQYPQRRFRAMNVNYFESVLSAMRDCDAAVYLIHSMGESGNFEETELHAARMFARAAEQAGIQRIVYLGGIRPEGTPSRHLRSRLRTGEVLRQSSVSTIELQATMVMGSGSESWRIVRDLAARLPVMLLPRWLDNQSQPVYIDDVTEAICHALTMEVPGGGNPAYALPGPETLSAREIISRIAHLMGLEPRMLRVPVITPLLSSYWISLVTSANGHIARQLVEGLRSDLTSPDQGFWRFMPDHERVGFDEAATRALAADEKALPMGARVAEWLIHRLTPAPSMGKPKHSSAAL